MIPPEHTGKPHLCVVHAWGAPFRDMVQSLVDNIVPECELLGCSSMSMMNSANLPFCTAWNLSFT